MSYDLFTVEGLRATEQHLRDIGCEKCSVCKQFMSKEYINEKNVCTECIKEENA
jgi:hypothetical protein